MNIESDSAHGCDCSKCPQDSNQSQETTTKKIGKGKWKQSKCFNAQSR